MPRKRPSVKTADSPPPAKRVKEDPEDNKPQVEPEESPSRTARRRHVSRQAIKEEAQVDAGPSAAKETPAEESHSDWEERWISNYPSEHLVRAVGAVRRSGTTVPATSTTSTREYVYVVALNVSGQHVGPEFDILSIYNDVNLANEHALEYVNDGYRDFARLDDAVKGLNHHNLGLA